MTTYEVLVDPERMVQVEVESPDGPRFIAAVTCGYVPARGADKVARVALQIVFDPDVPHPAMPYYCPAGRLQSLLIAPKSARKITPYRG